MGDTCLTGRKIIAKNLAAAELAGRFEALLFGAGPGNHAGGWASGPLVHRRSGISAPAAKKGRFGSALLCINDDLC